MEGEDVERLVDADEELDAGGEIAGEGGDETDGDGGGDVDVTGGTGGDEGGKGLANC